MFNFLLTELSTITLYKNVLNDKAVHSLILLLQLMYKSDSDLEDMLKAYCGIYSELLCAMKYPDFYEHLSNLLLYDENPFTLACERNELCAKSGLKEQAKREYSIMYKLAMAPCSFLKNKLKEKNAENAEIGKVVDELPEWNHGALKKHDKHLDMILSDRIQVYEKNGSGLFLKHYFFAWDGESKQIMPVKNPDLVALEKLYLVENQKETVLENTHMFLEGLPANNILLYGDRGTGKSSMVKAIVNKFCHLGLRLLEIPCKYLDQIPTITSRLFNRGVKFILFVDDLSFANNEEKYTALKGVLEGGIEHRPDNILLYATSNRRHLIKETFSERTGLSSDSPDEEVRARDNIQEKLSLSDRFGITVVFTSPLKKEYLQIVHKMAKDEGINIAASLLEQKAMQWEMAYNGMTPRTARQFINWLKGECHDFNTL